MAEPTSSGGLLKLVRPEHAGEDAPERGDEEAVSENVLLRREIVNRITAEFQSARDFRVSEGIEELLLAALRSQRGEYSPEKLQQIQQFSGSQVYARITAAKCRGATAILKDIYLNADDPWVLEPTPVPTLPDDAAAAVMQLVQSEVSNMQAAGQPVDEEAFQRRVRELMDATQKAALRTAVEETARAEGYLRDLLVEGGFYEALAEFLIDLPMFPYACIKGPMLRNKTQISWVEGQASLTTVLRLFWQRVSPFDLWFTPGASGVKHSAVMERIPLTREELLDLKGLPGYDDDAIDRVLYEFEGQSEFWQKWASNFETQRRELEIRGAAFHYGDGNFIDTLEYHGYMRGQWLLDWGLPESEVPDPLQEYYVTAWVASDELIKVHLNPNPRQRPIYYVTSYEKVPGSLVGHGLPQILSDIQEVANATLRALVNNLSIASGPQVEVNTERMAPNADAQSLYPWKRWFTKSDPFGANTTQPAVMFWQPQSNAHELLNVYKEFTNMADEISAIPRYMSGSPRAGGAASTASGLAMLMDNSSRVMQSVISNVDREVLRPMVEELYDMVMLLHPDKLRGDETIVVKGVANALKREQDRVRQLEFLQITANPIDVGIIGPDRRAAILRAVAKDIGLPHEDIVPSNEEIRKAMEQPPPQEQQPPGAPSAPAPSQGGAPHLNTQANGRST